MTQDKEKAKGSLRGDQDSLMFGQGFSFSGYERDPLYLSLGGRKFLDISGCSGIDSVSDGRAGVFADFDNDGDQDVFMTTIQGQAHLLFRNNVGPGRFLRVLLEGTRAGRDAFAAIAKVTTSAGVLTKVKAGGNGYISQNDPRLLFGLGNDRQVDGVDVVWPDGGRERFAGPFAAGTTVKLVQGTSRAQPLTLPASRLPDPLSPDQALAATLRFRTGQEVPNVAVRGLDGRSTSLRGLLKPGRRLLVNLWATWCIPCRREMPELEALRPRLGARGIDLVGLSVDAEPEAPVAAFANGRVTYPVYRLDAAAVAQLYATEEVTVPLSLVVGPDGRVQELLSGWSDRTRRRLERLLEP